MKSRTSFFNKTVLRKDITRFAPAWGLYLTAMLLLSLALFTEEEVYLAQMLGVTIGIYAVVNFFYALVVTALLFGDLFNARLCNALHAMPMRREGWFLTHLTSGALFSVIPNLVVALCLMPQLGEYWYVAFIWLGGMTMNYLFFLGAATLAVMCTGSRFAMALVYGLINFLSILAMWILQYLYEPLLYGIEINAAPFVFCSPVSYLCTHELEFLPFDDELLSYAYRNSANGWPYVTGIALIGLAMLVIALVLYRKRHLESAGDFITVQFLSPVFLVLYTLAAGMALFLFSRLFDTNYDYLFLAVGIVAGYITGSMLLKRTVRVFKPATLVGMAVLVAVLFGSLGLTRLDALGIVRYTPKAETVKSVSISYGSTSEWAYTTEDDAEILELIDIHQEFIDERNVDTPVWFNSIYMTYTLDNGKTITRRYRMNFDAQAAVDLAPWFSKAEFVLHTEDVAGFADRVKYVELENYSDKYYPDTAIEPFQLVEEREKIRDLVDAIIADCEAGRMIQDHEYYSSFSDEPYSIGYINIHLTNDTALCLSLWKDNTSTYNWLQDNLWESEN